MAIACMHECMYVCLYACTYVCMYVYTTYLSTYVCMYLFMYVYMYMYLCMNVCMHVYNLCMRAYEYAYLYNIHVCVRLQTLVGLILLTARQLQIYRIGLDLYLATSMATMHVDAAQKYYTVSVNSIFSMRFKKYQAYSHKTFTVKFQTN